SFGYSSSWHIVFSLLSAGFRPFRSILRASLFAIGDADRVERAANHVIADAGKILHAAAPDQDNRVLLQVVTDAGDVSRDLDTVGQAHARDFAERRVRFLRCLRVNTGTDTTLLGEALKRGTGRFVLHLLAAFANKLINRRHC